MTRGQEVTHLLRGYGDAQNGQLWLVGGRICSSVSPRGSIMFDYWTLLVS